MRIWIAILAVLGMMIIPMKAQATAVDEDVGIIANIETLEASIAIHEAQVAQIANIENVVALGTPATESPPGHDEVQATYLMQISAGTANYDATNQWPPGYNEQHPAIFSSSYAIDMRHDEDIGNNTIEHGAGGIALAHGIVRRDHHLE